MIQSNNPRKFELVNNAQVDLSNIPTRATRCSAGYDFKSAYDYVISPGEIVIVKTDIKARMGGEEFLQLSLRSSLGKEGLLMMNSPGIVDSDYYSNEKNDGNIGFIIKNTDKDEFIIHRGDKIGQGIFQHFNIVDNDVPVSEDRLGGFGSTGK